MALITLMITSRNSGILTKIPSRLRILLISIISMNTAITHLHNHSPAHPLHRYHHQDSLYFHRERRALFPISCGIIPHHSSARRGGRGAVALRPPALSRTRSSAATFTTASFLRASRGGNKRSLHRQIPVTSSSTPSPLPTFTCSIFLSFTSQPPPFRLLPPLLLPLPLSLLLLSLLSVFLLASHPCEHKLPRLTLPPFIHAGTHARRHRRAYLFCYFFHSARRYNGELHRVGRGGEALPLSLSHPSYCYYCCCSLLRHSISRRFLPP